MKLPGIVCGLWLLWVLPAAATQVYRCEGPDGAPVFQQTACTGVGGPVQLSGPAARWEALRPGERALLEAASRPSETRPKSRPDTGDEQPTVRPASERSCWQKQQRLEVVSAKLRRGYKPAQGERLRRRRDQLTEFIRRYCD